MSKKRIRILYILDNLDRYHFYFSRYSFFPEDSQEQYENVYRNIGGLINKFSEPSELGNSGLCVLMLCRSYVYQYCRHEDNPCLPQEDDSSVFQIKSPSLIDILSSIFKLFEEAINSIKPSQPTKSNEWIQVLFDLKTALTIQSISEYYKEEADKYIFRHSGLEAIKQLCHHGYRSFITFFSSLKLNYKDYHIMERLLLKQPITLIILYINDLKKRYTQYNDHFPNMFLNDCIILCKLNRQKEYFQHAHKSHKHTYWLKYFILKYLVIKRDIEVEDIVELFVGKGKYDEHLVLHVLGSLCTSNEFSCADVNYSRSNINIMYRRIIPTNRGKYLVSFDNKLFPGHNHKVDFCFSFIYLQLIIDDYLLSFPRPWIDKVFVDKNYAYLYKNEHDYGESALEQIRSKSIAVIYFLRILLASLRVEEEIKKELFQYLKDKGIIPNINNIVSSIKEELRQLYSTMNIPNQYQIIEQLWEEIHKSEEYEQFFRKYYNSNVEIS